MQTSSCLTLRSSIKSQKSDICFKVKLKSSTLNFGPFLRKYASLGKWFGKPRIPEKFMHAYLEIRMLASGSFITPVESTWIYEFWILKQWSCQGRFAASKTFLSSCYLQKFSIIIFREWVIFRLPANAPKCYHKIKHWRAADQVDSV